MFENFKEKFTDTAKAAAKASSDFIEISKMNLSIKSFEDKVKAEKIEMGNMIYETYKQGRPVDSDLSAKCDTISNYENNISELRQKILELKSKRICSTCSTELDRDSVYCYKCGSKL